MLGWRVHPKMTALDAWVQRYKIFISFASFSKIIRTFAGETIIHAMNIQEILNKTDRFAANAGCRITEVDEQHAVAEMTVTPAHLNGGNVCQGGALFTLADLAIAALMNCRGQLTFGISNSIMFVASAKEGDHLRAEAVSVADHPKIPSVEVRVTNQEGRLICHVTGMGYRKAIAVGEV